MRTSWQQSCLYILMLKQSTAGMYYKKYKTMRFQVTLKANRLHPRDYLNKPLITDTQTDFSVW